MAEAILDGTGTTGKTLKINSVNAGLVQDVELTQAIENNANGQPVYLGKSSPGTAKNVTGWQIQKIIYDGSSFLTDIQWASGDANFDKIWDSRAGYSYS